MASSRSLWIEGGEEEFETSWGSVHCIGVVFGFIEECLSGNVIKNKIDRVREIGEECERIAVWGIMSVDPYPMIVARKFVDKRSAIGASSISWITIPVCFVAIEGCSPTRTSAWLVHFSLEYATFGQC